MRKRIIIAAGAFLLVTTLVLVLLGSNGTSIVGKWQDTHGTATIEFTKTGEYIVRNVDFTDAGTYELTGKDTVKVTLSDNFSYTFPYTISGNTMKTLDAQAMTFERISQ